MSSMEILSSSFAEWHRHAQAAVRARADNARRDGEIARIANRLRAYGRSALGRRGLRKWGAYAARKQAGRARRGASSGAADAFAARARKRRKAELWAAWRHAVATLLTMKLFFAEKKTKGRVEILQSHFKGWRMLTWRRAREVGNFAVHVRARKFTATAAKLSVRKWRFTRLQRKVQRSAIVRVAKRRERGLCRAAVAALRCAAHESAADVHMQKILYKWRARGSAEILRHAHQRWKAFVASRAAARAQFRLLGNALVKLTIKRELKDAIHGTRWAADAEARWASLAGALWFATAKRELGRVLQRNASLEHGARVRSARESDAKRGALRRWQALQHNQATLRAFSANMVAARDGRAKMHVVNVWCHHTYVSRTLARLRTMLSSAYAFDTWAANVARITHQRGVMERCRDMLWPDVHTHLKSHMFALWREHYGAARARAQLERVLALRDARYALDAWRGALAVRNGASKLVALRARSALRVALAKWDAVAHAHNSREAMLAAVCAHAHARVLARTFALMQGGVATQRAFTAGQSTARRLMLRAYLARLRAPFARLVRVYHRRAHLPRTEQRVARRHRHAASRAALRAWCAVTRDAAHVKAVCARVMRGMLEVQLRKVHMAWNSWTTFAHTARLVASHSAATEETQQLAEDRAVAVALRSLARMLLTRDVARWREFARGRILQRKVMQHALLAYTSSGVAAAFRTLVENSAGHERKERLSKLAARALAKRRTARAARIFAAWLRVVESKAFLQRVCGRAMRNYVDGRTRVLTRGWHNWRQWIATARLVAAHADATLVLERSNVERAAAIMLRNVARRSKQGLLRKWFGHVAGRKLQRKVMTHALVSYQSGGVAAAFRSLQENVTRCEAARAQREQLRAVTAALNRRYRALALAQWSAVAEHYAATAALERRALQLMSSRATRTLTQGWLKWRRVDHAALLLEQHQAATAALILKGWNRRRRAFTFKRWRDNAWEAARARLLEQETVGRHERSVKKRVLSHLYAWRTQRKGARRVMNRMLHRYAHGGLAHGWQSLLSHSESQQRRYRQERRATALRARHVERALRRVFRAWRSDVGARAERLDVLHRAVEARVLRASESAWRAWRAQDFAKQRALACVRRVVKALSDSRFQLLSAGWLRWRGASQSLTIVSSHARDVATRVMGSLLRRNRELCARRLTGGWHAWRQFSAATHASALRDAHALEIKRRIIGSVLRRLRSKRAAVIAFSWARWHRRVVRDAHDEMRDGVGAMSSNAAVETAAKLMRNQFNRRRKRRTLELWKRLFGDGAARRSARARARGMHAKSLARRSWAALVLHARGRRVQRKIITRALFTYTHAGVAHAFRQLVENMASHALHVQRSARADSLRAQHNARRLRAVLQGWRGVVAAHRMARIALDIRFSHWAAVVRVRNSARRAAMQVVARITSGASSTLLRVIVHAWHKEVLKSHHFRAEEEGDAKVAAARLAFAEEHSERAQQWSHFSFTALDSLLRARHRRRLGKALATWAQRTAAVRVSTHRACVAMLRIVERRRRMLAWQRAQALLLRWRVRAALLIPIAKASGCGICGGHDAEIVCNTHDGWACCAECKGVSPVDLRKIDIAGARAVCPKRALRRVAVAALVK